MVRRDLDQVRDLHPDVFRARKRNRNVVTMDFETTGSVEDWPPTLATPQWPPAIVRQDCELGGTISQS